MARLVSGPRPRKARAEDLAILFPDRTVWIRGETWTVREYSLLEASRFFALGLEACRSLGENRPNWRAIVALLAAATGRGEYEIGALEDDDFDRLLLAWREIDLPLFEQVAAGEQSDSRLPWSDVHATLIAHGHSPERIGNYTARQIDLHYSAAVRRERREQAKRISDISFGMAKAKDAKARIAELNKGTPR